jgi:hypothetical protein
MSYTIGVSSGIFGAATQEERFAFVSVGLPKKAQYAITKGVQFVQIDLESISEFEEFEIEKKMEQVASLGISFGIHSETPAFGSREFPHLDSAIKPDYRRGHERLITILTQSGKIKVKYVLVHSSESIPFQFLARELQPTELVDPWGRDLKFFIDSHKEIYLNGGQKDITKTWLWKQDEIWKDVLHDTPEGTLKRAKVARIQSLDEFARRSVVIEKVKEKQNEKINKILKQEFSAREDYLKQKEKMLALQLPWKTNEEYLQKQKAELALRSEVAKLSEDVAKRKRELEESIKVDPSEITIDEKDNERIEFEKDIEWKAGEEVWKAAEAEELLSYFERLIQSRQLSYGPERIAYYIMAKWMEVTDHRLWKPIINITIDYYAKKDKKTREQWLKDKGIKEISIDDQIFQKDYRLWVPSVSALYVLGHFRKEDAPTIYNNETGEIVKPEFTVEDPKKILEKEKLYFVFETPMAGSGMEDLLRFPQPAQMYYLVKEMKSDWFGIAVDIEHMLMDGLNVETAIDVMPPDSGKMVRVVHSGYPSPLGPAHIPIPLGSDQQLYLYKTYWNLRQKGMGKNDEVFVIFERTGGADPIQQSVLALRLIKQFLEKDVPPEKLPLEFYGLEPGQWASTERQKAQILEHAYDPLKGMLQVPEEEHGFLSKAAVEKGKTEEWRKEKYR